MLRIIKKSEMLASFKKFISTPPKSNIATVYAIVNTQLPYKYIWLENFKKTPPVSQS